MSSNDEALDLKLSMGLDKYTPILISDGDTAPETGGLSLIIAAGISL